MGHDPVPNWDFFVDFGTFFDICGTLWSCIGTFFGTFTSLFGTADLTFWDIVFGTVGSYSFG